MNVAVCWDKAYEEPWVLMTTHSDLRKAIQTYGNRSGIEPMHKGAMPLTSKAHE